MAEEFENLVLATWAADGQLPIPLAVASVMTEIENTLVKQRRPYVPGAKLDNMGQDVIVRQIEVHFFNGCEEPGIPSEGYYPAYLNALEASLEVQKTGTLTIGRWGPIRGQIKHLRIAENSDARNAAWVSITFWQDTEDSITAASFAPSASSALPVLATDIYDEALDAGIWSEQIPTLSSNIGSLADALSTPIALLGTALGAVSVVLDAAAMIEDLLSQSYDTTAPAGASIALDCDAALFVLYLRRTRDRAAEARGVLLQQTPRTKTVSFKTVVSIFDVAAKYGQSVEDLVAINTGKLDPGVFYAIPPGTQITIEAA